MLMHYKPETLQCLFAASRQRGIVVYVKKKNGENILTFSQIRLFETAITPQHLFFCNRLSLL